MKNLSVFYKIYIVFLLSNCFVFAQTYTSPASFSFANTGTNASFTTKYILVNTSTNLIAYLSTTTSFSGVVTGTYTLYGVNYDQSGTAPTLTVGTNLSAIGGTCVALSSSLSVTVSAATSATFTAPASFSFNNSGNNNALTTVYVLVNTSTNLIAYLSNTASFSAIEAGTYTLYGINYNATGTAPTLTLGTNLSGIGGSCVALSSSLSVVVNCATNLILTSTTNDISSGTMLKKASVSINATNMISGTATVSYQSAGSIVFSAGFKAEPSAGGYLVSTIAGCN